MRAINIDTENAAAIKAGQIGEHNATTITFTVPAELAAAADYYRGAIEVNGEVHYTLPIAKGTETQHFKLESEHTAAVEAYLTIEGYKDAGNFVGKSAKTVLCFGDAAGGETPAENTGTLAGLVDAAVEAALDLDGIEAGAKEYQSADDLPAGAATDTLAVVRPAPDWTRAPESIFKGQFVRRIYYNENPPNPAEVLTENKPAAKIAIQENIDGQKAAPVLYIEAAIQHDFLAGNPGIVYLWGFDENGEPTKSAIYMPTEIEFIGEEEEPIHFDPGWYSLNLNTGEIAPGTFDDIGLPIFDFEPRLILYPGWLNQLVAIGYQFGIEASFENANLGYFIATTPYTAATIYRKTETGWEAVT